MYTRVEQKKENIDQPDSNEFTKTVSSNGLSFQFVDNRSKSIAQIKIQEKIAHNSYPKQDISFQKKQNKTGLPDNLKSGIENLSGYSMDDVKVHYNSPRPAQLQAHAYAQGTDIHLGSGQEKHLPHEAWHVVQQKQGRVKPTMQMMGKVAINDDDGLEKEVDVMGKKAYMLSTQSSLNESIPIRNIISYDTIQRIKINGVLIRPYGKTGKELWDITKKRMIVNGLSPYGAKKIFLQRVKYDINYENELQFINPFLEDALQEAKRNEQQKQLSAENRTRSWTRHLKLTRPGWAMEHKSAVKPGQDIRHVVRNTTIRSALKKEFDIQILMGQATALGHFKKIAGQLNIVDDFGTAWEYLDCIYKKAYLNFGNLFPGPGGINRVIGLTADPIYNLGVQWESKMGMVKSTEIDALFDSIAWIIANQTDSTERAILSARDKGKINDKGVTEFLLGLEHFFDNITDYLIDLEENYFDRAQSFEQTGQGGVIYYEIGRELIDIGANFGFDIPIDAVGSDQMEILIQAEKFLAIYDGKNPEELIEVLNKFLQLQDILSRSTL